MNIDVLLPSIPLVLLRAQILSTHKSPATASPSHAFHIHISKHFSEPHVVLHKMQKGCVMQMQDWKWRRAEISASGVWRYVISERCSQLGINMFQTNVTPRELSWSNALQRRVHARPCFPANEESNMGKARFASHLLFLCFGCVCLAPLSLRLQSVTVSGDGRSASAAPHLLPSLFCLLPSPGSSSTPAPWAGQRFLSNWRQRQSLMHSLFVSPHRALTRSLHLRPEQLT